jgi:hypothetical protein
VWNNKELLKSLLSKQPKFLEFIHDDLRADLDLVLVAVSVDNHYRDIYKHIHPSLMADIDTLARILEADFHNKKFYADHYLYRRIEPTFLHDKSIALFLLSASPHSSIFEYLSLELKADIEVVTKAVEVNGMNLLYVSPILKSDRKLTILALRQNGLALKYVHPTFKDDVEMAMIAIDNDPNAIEYVSVDVKQRIHGRSTKSARVRAR